MTPYGSNPEEHTVDSLVNDAAAWSAKAIDRAGSTNDDRALSVAFGQAAIARAVAALALAVHGHRDE